MVLHKWHFLVGNFYLTLNQQRGTQTAALAVQVININLQDELKIVERAYWSLHLNTYDFQQS